MPQIVEHLFFRNTLESIRRAMLDLWKEISWCKNHKLYFIKSFFVRLELAHHIMRKKSRDVEVSQLYDAWLLIIFIGLIVFIAVLCIFLFCFQAVFPLVSSWCSCTWQSMILFPYLALQETCVLSLHLPSASRVINERDDKHSACLPQVLWLTLLEVLFAWGILAASTFLLFSLSCTTE